MNQLYVGITLVVLGIILSVIRFKGAAEQPGESTTSGKPYLKNAGIGLILIGIYYLVRYLISLGSESADT